MKAIEIYETFDGQRFDDAASAKRHEAKQELYQQCVADHPSVDGALELIADTPGTRRALFLYLKEFEGERDDLREMEEREFQTEYGQPLDEA